MTEFAGTTLDEARDWVRERADDGVHCPCCTQLAKVYRRKINSGAASGLIQMWREFKRDWVHIPSTGHLARLGGEFARLRYWGLIVEEPELREDGGRAGWWQITERGVEFVNDRGVVPKYARIYDGRLLGFVTEEFVSIRDALGTQFNYTDLMEGR